MIRKVKGTTAICGHSIDFEISLNTPPAIYYESEQGKCYFQVKEEWIDRKNGGFSIPCDAPEFALLRKKGSFVLRF